MTKNKLLIALSVGLISGLLTAPLALADHPSRYHRSEIRQD